MTCDANALDIQTWSRWNKHKPGIPTVWIKETPRKCRTLSNVLLFFSLPIPMLPIKLEQDDDDGVLYSG